VAVLAIFIHSIFDPGAALAQTDEATFVKLDINEDGVLSGKEAKSVLQFDANQDGEVTREEYLAGIAAERKRLLSIDDNKLFTERDGNEDGVLSGTEVLGFEKYDADGDGEVSRKEFDKGRAADRGVPNKDEQLRLARIQFQKLDVNEDGRLSGKEMIGLEKLDSNGDGRITEQEFLEGYQPQAPIGTPVGLFLKMLQTSDPTDFLNAAETEFAKGIDPPVLAFILQELADKLGTMAPSAENALRPKQETVNKVTRTVYEGKLEFDKGKLDVGLIVRDGRIVGFELKAPELDDVDKRLHQALFENQGFSKSIAEFYTPRCRELIRLILAGEDDKAFAKYHPEVQKQVGRKKALAMFAAVRESCGALKAVELESLQVQFDAKGESENVKLVHLVRGSKGNYFATTTIQFIGLAAHIVGLSVKAADPASIEDQPEPPVAPAPSAPAAPAAPPLKPRVKAPLPPPKLPSP